MEGVLEGKATAEWTTAQKSLVRQVTGPKFWMYLLRKLPMGFLAGIRIHELTEASCTTTVPFKWLNQNPFQSIYFAVQSMAAELSTASHCMVATAYKNPSVAFIIVDLKADFSKKATGKVYFTCLDGPKAYTAVEECMQTGEARKVTFNTVGKMADGTEVARFQFTWSFKQRRS